jgi:K+-transporting ATPase ATPase C chain
MNQVRPALVIFLTLAAITGVAYPLAVTGIAQAFPNRATGSIITRDGKAVGSSLIGQDFSNNPKYFWGRPSATGPVPYTSFNADKATGSSGSNLGPTNPALFDNVKARIEALKAADVAAGLERRTDQKVPVDLVTASGSGLDPHISPAAAEYQLPRIAKARALSEDRVRELIKAHTSGRQLAVLGEPRVNVLELNLALDQQSAH